MMAQPTLAPAKTVERNELTLFLEGRLTDVEFLVEHGSDPPKVFKAHKMMLALRNEVFEAMFYGKLPEKDQVRITDLYPDGFSTFLNYIYSRRASFENIQHALRTRTAAQKYMESKLVEVCDAFIRREIKPTNVCIVLDYLEKHGNTVNFDDVINAQIREKTLEVLMSPAFITASQESVMRILKTPVLSIREYDIIKWVYQWAVVHCKQEPDKPTIATLQQTMSPFLPELRFLALTSQEFLKGPCSWKVLTQSETLAVLSNIINPGFEELPKFINKNTRNRNGQPPKPEKATMTVERFCQYCVNGRWW